MHHEHVLAGAVLMVRPRHLAANPETAASNVFQASTTDADARVRGEREQDALAGALQAAGVRVIVLEPSSLSPDAVFPNNWFSTHDDGRLVLYPMEARSRRGEVMHDLPERLREAGFRVTEVVDLTRHADERRYLEGTGSLVLDRMHRVAYAVPSTRTDPALVDAWAERFGFTTCLFSATDPAGRPVYHTNVVMGLGAGLAIVCLASVRDVAERRRLVRQLEDGGHEILDIDWSQVCEFAGNQLFLQGRDGPLAVLSARADAALRPGQKRRIDAHAERITADVTTIERHGGGSVRCMLAEIFLPRRTGKRQGEMHDT